MDVSGAEYRQVDERSVRVSGGRWIPAEPYTVKAEGAAEVGYRAISVFGVRDPRFLGRLDEIVKEIEERTRGYFEFLGEGAYRAVVRVYGRDGVLGVMERDAGVGHEVGILVEVVGRTPEVAESVCAFMNSSMFHHGFPGRLSTAGNLAIPFSPTRAVVVGPAYIFNIWHAIPLDDPAEPFRMRVVEFPRR